MASEALYAGLAAGGNELASIMREKRKAELEAKLMAEREARAEQRETAREARAEARRLKQPARRELDPARGVIVVYNSEDEVLKEIPATAAELTKASQESRAAELRLQGLEREASVWEKDRAMSEEIHRARLGLVGAQTAAAGRRGREDAGSDEDGATLYDYADLFVKEYGDLMDEYGPADDKGKKSMPKSQKMDVGRLAAQRARADKKPPQVAVREVLDEIAGTRQQRMPGAGVLVLPKKGEAAAAPVAVNPFANQGK